MNLIVPGLLWPFVGDIDHLYSQIKMDNLNQLIKGSAIKIHNVKYSDFIYSNLYNIDGKKLAYHIAQVNNLLDKHPYFLVVEPTHLRIDRDRLLICEPELLQLNHEKELFIINTINQHFNNEATMYFIHSNFWLIGINFSVEISYPLIDIVGQNIDDYLPQDKNGVLFSKLLNEIQMLLFNLPLNNMRKSEGSLTVNSVWMWDTIVYSPTLYNKSEYALFTNNKTLLSVSDINIKELPNDFNLLSKDSSIFIDSLYYPSSYADSISFIEVLEAFDREIAFNLNKKLKHNEINHINLFIPQQSNTIEIVISKYDKYKFWRNKNLFKIFNRYVK